MVGKPLLLIALERVASTTHVMPIAKYRISTYALMHHPAMCPCNMEMRLGSPSQSRVCVATGQHQHYCEVSPLLFYALKIAYSRLCVLPDSSLALC